MTFNILDFLSNTGNVLLASLVITSLGLFFLTILILKNKKIGTETFLTIIGVLLSLPFISLFIPQLVPFIKSFIGNLTLLAELLNFNDKLNIFYLTLIVIISLVFLVFPRISKRYDDYLLEVEAQIADYKKIIKAFIAFTFGLGLFFILLNSTIARLLMILSFSTIWFLYSSNVHYNLNFECQINKCIELIDKVNETGKNRVIRELSNSTNKVLTEIDRSLPNNLKINTIKTDVYTSVSKKNILVSYLPIYAMYCTKNQQTILKRDFNTISNLFLQINKQNKLKIRNELYTLLNSIEQFTQNNNIEITEGNKIKRTLSHSYGTDNYWFVLIYFFIYAIVHLLIIFIQAIANTQGETLMTIIRNLAGF